MKVYVIYLPCCYVCICISVREELDHQLHFQVKGQPQIEQSKVIQKELVSLPNDEDTVYTQTHARTYNLCAYTL